MTHTRPVLMLIAVAAAGCASVNGHAGHEPLHIERVRNGPAVVVVLPGLFGSTRYWNGSRFERLAETSSSLFIDPLGFGRSPKPRADYTLDEPAVRVRTGEERLGRLHQRRP